MLVLVLTFHTLISILLIVVVLLQAGRGAELGAAFGGIGQAAAGRPPTTLLTKVTAVLATLFMLSSLWLAFWYRTVPSSVVQPKQSASSTLDTPSPAASEGNTPGAAIPSTDTAPQKSQK